MAKIAFHVSGKTIECHHIKGYCAECKKESPLGYRACEAASKEVVPDVPGEADGCAKADDTIPDEAGAGTVD